MTDTRLLRTRIEESGLKFGYIVKKLNTSYNWLNKKIENEVPFKAYEIQILCKMLNITELDEKERISKNHK